MKCRCRDQIDKLRTIMELTFDEFLSFSDPSVLLASQALDDALVQYRKCPHYEQCMTWGRTPKKEDEQKQMIG
ncbi:aspartyl-phosphate phosphatase Spo0E family protein [Paenibacillus sp. GCM10027627]|uniref:aspartyl-phosphate phosphatase Spo0E family protein n=1 Tax=unclassified Paenibacillus TaxID=185978 RepID=UPI00362AB46C